MSKLTLGWFLTACHYPAALLPRYRVSDLARGTGEERHY